MVVLIRYNLPAVFINKKDIIEIEHKNNLVYVYLRNRRYVGYMIKEEL